MTDLSTLKAYRQQAFTRLLRNELHPDSRRVLVDYIANIDVQIAKEETK